MKLQNTSNKLNANVKVDRKADFWFDADVSRSLMKE